jgi:hydrogenase nickel incorporation protein HypA/HybF
MHETALVRDLVRHIDQIARAAGARRVVGVKIWLSALSHLSVDHFREHFSIEARDTLAAGAALQIDMSSNSNDPYAQICRQRCSEWPTQGHRRLGRY